MGDLPKDVGNEGVLATLERTFRPVSVDLGGEEFGTPGEKPTAAAESGDEPTLAGLVEGTAATDISSADTLIPSGTASASDAPTIPSASGERYLELEQVGSGGMGQVMAAHDLDLRRVVVLKRLHPELTRPHYVSRLVQEAQVTAQLDHPNIPSVHGLGIDADGRVYFAMELIRGHTLTDRLDKHHAEADPDDPELERLTIPRLLRVLRQVGFTVAFAHSRGVLHRDIKPDNIIVGEYGEVRLMDWGIAKILNRPDLDDAEPDALDPMPDLPPVVTSEDRPATQAGVFAGTPGYASPEQAEGRADIDVRSDVYSLGAVLYQMLCGQPPVSGTNVVTVVQATLQGEIRPITERVPVPDRLAAVVHKALAQDRDQRYADVQALLDDIEALLEDRPVSALEENPLEWLGRAYLGRSARLSQLTTMELDMLCGSCSLFGAAVIIGVGLIWGMAWFPALLVVALVLMVAMSIPWVRGMRRDPAQQSQLDAHAAPGSVLGSSRASRPGSADTTQPRRRCSPSSDDKNTTS